MSRAIRVLIADDHPPTRAGVRMALEAGGFEVCAESGDAQSAVEAALRERPEVCLLDIHMPGDGIHAAEAISHELPDAAVVMLTVSRADADLFDALCAGASGYLLKDMDPARLPAARGTPLCPAGDARRDAGRGPAAVLAGGNPGARARRARPRRAHGRRPRARRHRGPRGVPRPARNRHGPHRRVAPRGRAGVLRAARGRAGRPPRPLLRAVSAAARQSGGGAAGSRRLACAEHGVDTASAARSCNTRSGSCMTAERAASV